MLAKRPCRPGFARRHRATLGALAVLAVALGMGIAEASHLTLTWEDPSGGETAFGIERRTDGIDDYELIAEQAAGAPSYVDTSVSPSTTYCYRVQAVDGDRVSGYSNEACGTTTPGFDVSVVTLGTGTVSSSPAGIACGTDCWERYEDGSVVTLTASAPAGSIFTGWSGGCSGTGACTLTGNSPTAVTATFAPALPMQTLTVYRKGSGSVDSTPGELVCTSTTCRASYAKGTRVILTAAADPGTRFLRWSGGGCTGTRACTVALDRNVAVWAVFGK
jgi:hypothetical protein